MGKIRKEHLNCLDTKESKQLIDIPKFYNHDIDWKASNNANYIAANFPPLDASDDLKGTIPGVTIQIDHKRPIRIKNSRKTVITLFKLKTGVKYRAYQVEACSEKKISSHNGTESILGCHEHLGKEVNKISPLYSIEDIPGWFNFFCGKVNLNFTGKINSIFNE